MARRRRLANALSGAGDAASTYFGMLLRQQFAEEQQKRALEAQADKEQVDAYNTTLSSLGPEQVNKFGPQAVSAQATAARRRLSPRQQARVGELPDFASMEASPAERLAPARKSLQEADRVDKVPSIEGLISMLQESRVDPGDPMGVPTGGLGPSPEMFSFQQQAGQKRNELLAGETREGFQNPVTGETSFLSEREQGQRGAIKTGLTSAENAARQAEQTTATAQATADVDNNPQNVRGAASRAGAIQGAQTNAQQGAMNSPTNIAGAANRAGAIAAAERQAQLTAEMQSAGMTKDQIAAGLQLADNFTKDSSDFFTRERAIRDIQTFSKDATGTSDLGLIYAYIKMLDARTGVKEGEVINAQNIGSIPERVAARYNQIVGNGKLTGSERKMFVDSARSIYASAKQGQAEIERDYTDRAKMARVPPTFVVRKPSESLEAEPEVAGSGALDRLRGQGRQPREGRF